MGRSVGTLRSLFFAMSSGLLFVGPALADSLSGRVLDSQGAVVPNVRLRLFDRTSGQIREAVSAADGRYAFAGIPEGQYVLEGSGAAGSLSGTTIVTVAGDRALDLTLAVSGIATEVVVTASGTPLSVEEVAKAVDVIDAEELALRNELSISEAIRTVPGIRVRTLRGPGSYTTIQARGLRNQDTALLIDGMRFRDAASPQGDATAFLQTLSTVDTERIEVMRGSGSSLYGSSAMAGVINVTSRTGGGAPQGDLVVEGGGLGLVRTVPSVRGGLADDRFTYSAALSYVNMTKGVRDGQTYRNVSPQGTVRYQFTPGVSLTGRFWYSDDESQTNESPAFPQEVLRNFPASGVVPAVALPTSQLERFERGLSFEAGGATFVPDQYDPDSMRKSSFFNGSAVLRHSMSAATTYQVSYQGVDTSREFDDGPLGGGAFEPATANTSRFDGRVDTVQARLDSTIGTFNFFSLGYEFEREEYFSASSDNDASVRIDTRSHALFAQDRLQFLGGRVQVTLGGRMQAFDLRDPTFVGGDHPYAGVPFEAPTAYTGDAAVAYVLQGNGTKLRAHMGNSYRAPAPFERFGGSFSSFSGSFSFWGDPRLEPERSVAVDGGVDQWLFDSRLQLGATLSHTDLRETIIFDFATFPAVGDPFGRFGGYRNTGGGHARGVELSANLSPGATTSVRVAYTYTDSESDTATIGSDFFRTLGVSDHMLTLTASQWIAERLNVTFDLFAASDYSLSPFGANGRRMIFAGPVKGDLVVRYDVPTGAGLRVDLYGKVENLFDQLYYENGFLGPGAWAIGGVRVRY